MESADGMDDWTVVTPCRTLEIGESDVGSGSQLCCEWQPCVRPLCCPDSLTDSRVQLSTSA